MGWGKFGLLSLVVVLVTSGQILFKMAAQSLKEPLPVQFDSLVRILTNPYLLTSLFVYGTATVLWLLVLRQMDLNKAYLVVAVTLVLVPLAGTIWFREPFTWNLLLGLGIILAGLVVAMW